MSQPTVTHAYISVQLAHLCVALAPVVHALRPAMGRGAVARAKPAAKKVKQPGRAGNVQHSITVSKRGPVDRFKADGPMGKEAKQKAPAKPKEKLKLQLRPELRMLQAHLQRRESVGARTADDDDDDDDAPLIQDSEGGQPWIEHTADGGELDFETVFGTPRTSIRCQE